MKNKIIIIICNVPNNHSFATSLAKKLIINKLAACVTLLPKTCSIYHWNKNIEKTKEIQLLIKTSITLEESVFKYIKSKHPYQIPELLTLKNIHAEEKYSSWICDNLL